MTSTHKAPRIDLETFTTAVFSKTSDSTTSGTSSSTSNLSISDIDGLTAQLATKIGANDAITLTNKTISATNNILQSIPTDIDSNSLSIAQISGLQTDLNTKASAIGLNTAKAGITSSQASAITANTAKTGISSSQASAITANTAKTGISSSQASAITANTAKTGISSSQASAIEANTAKTGITSAQTSAITANTAKTGITSAQASAITANTAKTGITTSQADAIIANGTNIGSKLSKNAADDTTGVITFKNGLKVGSTSDNVVLDKIDKTFTTSSGNYASDTQSNGFSIDDGSTNYMYIDEATHRVCVGKGAEPLTEEQSIVILANNQSNDWVNSSNSILPLVNEPNSIVFNATTPTNSYSGTDGDEYPILTRTGGGFYVKPIQKDSQSKAFVDTDTVATASSNYNLTYNDRTGEIMKRPVFDINYPLMSAMAQFGTPATATSSSIDTTEATKFPLRVNYFLADQNVTWSIQSKLVHDGASNTNASQTDYGDDMVAWFDGRVLAAIGFYVTSDERIKTNILDISDNEALTKFRMLKPKTYNYKDTIGRTNRKVFGFLAQDVREVIPEAVSLQKETLPNLMCIADVRNGILTLPLSSPVADLSLNYNDASNNNMPYGIVRCLVTPKEVKKDIRFIGIDITTNTLTMENENDLPQDELYFDEAQNTYNVVLEGTLVDDFHTLDKNSIYTLTTSAVQEIDRIQQEQATKIADLERRLALLEA